jgi:uncharacterized protein
MPTRTRTLCWTPLWSGPHPGVGLEHLLLSEGRADGVVLAVDDERGPLRLHYQLAWGADWQLASVVLTLDAAGTRQALRLRTDGQGRWHDANGGALGHLDGCRDIDIWPTPFTNTFPIRRVPLALGERREFLMAWVDGTALTVQPQRQAYTRLAERLYRFESLDGSGFTADLPVDEDGLVLDYPGLFRRVPAST